jgi:hypothetical protein
VTMPAWHFVAPWAERRPDWSPNKFAMGAQCNRQNWVMLPRLGDNLSESPNAAIKAEHGTQRLRLFKIVPLVRSWCGKASSGELE